MSIETYADALAFIHGRPRVKKQPTLARMRDFLAALGHPEAGQTYLHVTGTNGKGSVVAMSAAMLAASGLTVGTFTSPFITRFNERIAINDQPISDADLVKYTQQVAPIVAATDATRHRPPRRCGAPCQAPRFAAIPPPGGAKDWRAD